MSSKNIKLIRSLSATAVAASLLLSALPVAAASAALPPTQETQGSWTVSRLAIENGKQLESFKVSRDFAAWTMIDADGQTRRLFAFDGARISEVAVMDRLVWDRDADNGFFDHVDGNYDLNDGRLVWVASDGLDREIWSYDGFAVKQVSDNTYDDRHPITSQGRVAWTSQPGTVYNLMVSDRNGLYRLDSWQVTNYAFSGQNLFWLNRLPNENWFRVFRNDGRSTLAIGKGDDRALIEYFYADGQGSVAWEYSTKRWEYDKREIFLSQNGQRAIRVLQRDVPPNVMQIEDVVDGWVIVNVTDLMQSAIWNRVQLMASNGFQTKYLDRFTSPVKAQAVSADTVVRHLVPDTASALIISDGSKNDNFVRNQHVVHDLFATDGSGLMAAGLLEGGILTMKDGQIETIESPAVASQLAVNGCIAWKEGQTARFELKLACPSVAVKSNGQVTRVSGQLVKTEASPTVYLAAANGFRYAIPTETEFYGWYGDFDSLRVIGADEMSGMHLGGTVLLKPQYRPVKLASSPRIYTVAEDGLLRWVTSEETMNRLYGENWNRLVAVIPDHSLADYQIGSPLVPLGHSHLALAY